MRSVLFTPGDRGERIQSALTDGKADVVMADLEDAVMPDRKAEARRQILAAWKAAPKSRSLRGVRINAWPSPAAEADLQAVLPGKPDMIAVPKTHDVAAVRSLDARLKSFETSAGMLLGSIPLMLVLETASGILAARELAAASRESLRWPSAPKTWRLTPDFAAARTTGK